MSASTQSQTAQTAQHIVEKSTTSSGLLKIMLAAMCWGTGGAIAQSVYNHAATNAISVAFFRMGLAVPVLLLLSWRTLGPRLFQLHKRDLLPMFIAGTLVALYQALYFAAIPRIGIAIATLIPLCSAPVIVAVLSAILNRAWPQRVVLISLIIAIAGTVLLVQVQPSAEHNDVLGGVLLSLGSGLLYAINVLIGGKLGRSSQVHPLQTVTFGFAFGALVLLGIGLATGFVIQYPIEGWIGLIGLGLGPSAAGYALFYAGLRHTSSTVASIATLLEPLTATLLAVWLYHEPLSERAVLGGVLLVVAMVLLMVRRKAST